VVGRRDAATFEKLWDQIRQDGCVYFTDNYNVYEQIIPENQHIIGKDNTFLIEANNSNTRHRLARMTRRTKVVSKTDIAVDDAICVWSNLEVSENFENLQSIFLKLFNDQ